ncbi:hypothetical protein JCM16138_20980 [Thermococcus atlanticus]
MVTVSVVVSVAVSVVVPDAVCVDVSTCVDVVCVCVEAVPVCVEVVAGCVVVDADEEGWGLSVDVVGEDAVWVVLPPPIHPAANTRPIINRPSTKAAVFFIFTTFLPAKEKKTGRAPINIVCIQNY